MFDGLKDMGKLMKQAKEMRSKMKDVQKELKNFKATGRDKKQWVEVILTGELDCVGIEILNPDILNPSNKKELEKAIEQAFNDAAKRSKDTATAKLSAVSGGLNIPGLT